MAKQRQPLKLKEIKFVAAKVAGKTNRQAAADATGASLEVAAVQATRMLKNVNVQEAIADAFERAGITIDRVVQPISDGLDATKTVIIGKEEDAFADQIPDHSIRLKAAGMAAQFMGIGKADGGAQTINNFIVVTGDQKEKYGM